MARLPSEGSGRHERRYAVGNIDSFVARVTARACLRSAGLAPDSVDVRPPDAVCV